MLAGIPMGAVALGVCAWMLDYGDYVWQIAGAGALIGAVIGVIVGQIERQIRGELSKPDIATYLGMILGLFPGILVLGGIFGFIGSGGATVYIWTSLFLAGPMSGLLIGAMLDRANEFASKRNWISAILLACAAVAACGAPLFLIAK